ncbi:MAG: DEAD/DEAH box helicase family protein [Acidobacteriota bacterium]|nr:DEAD/DEAH box helicase family protein [Acidobacteriota bacterium]
MELKRYQDDALAILRKFLEEARVAGPKAAYERITGATEQANRLRGYAGSYKALTALPGVPYVCLRLPTGGGKTILAAHAVPLARDAWIEKDWPLVLWLVPTKTIRTQTAEALKDTRHPYRAALDEAFDGRLRVFDIADFAHVRPHDLHDHCCIVVGTIQALRVTNTEGRKVYAHNENLEPHFSGLVYAPEGLETLDNGKLKFSFANLLHLHRPLMIVDEAHNAVTGLTREMQARVNPCAIVEFTATPRTKSNILYSVTASELKAEDMIKLPVMLSEHDTWQNAVNGAVATRSSLSRTAADDPRPIRPIVLFQAQPRNREVTAAALKEHLVEVEQIAEEKIAVATGKQRELDGLDLFDPDCPIEHVITVEALKEGWDCSFAYVFCSVSRIQDGRDVEQLLGRVLRMPFAERRKDDALNRAYAFLSEPSFGHAARALVDKLVSMGFEEEEAEEHVEVAQRDLLPDDDLPAPRDQPTPTLSHIATASDDLLAVLKGASEFTLRTPETGKIEIASEVELDPDVVGAVRDALPEGERAEFDRAVDAYRAERHRLLSPAQRGRRLSAPRLTAAVQGEIVFADTELFMECRDWSLLDHSPKLAKEEFTVRETARSFEIDLDGQRVTYRFASEEEQLTLDIDVEGWTPQALVRWLDRQVRQADISQGELLRWLSELVNHLLVARGLHIAALMRCKFILARKVRRKIAAIRRKERESAYQQFLFEPTAKVGVSFDDAFAFRDGMYHGQRRYRGSWKPNRHFLGPDHVPAFDGSSDGEEFQCAQAIDSLPAVRYWVRNVANHAESFWLPTAAGRFYPDFVARLKDDRLLVVEYKGAHLAEGADTAEKRTIGNLWEQRSNGRCLFLVVEKVINGEDMRSQLLEKVGQ